MKLNCNCCDGIYNSFDVHFTSACDNRCAHCVDTVLGNVCPNCGGGFAPRPVRPAHDRKGGNFLGNDPASTQVRHRPVDPVAHAALLAQLHGLPPEQR